MYLEAYTNSLKALKATTPAEKLLTKYTNCITLMQYTTGKEYLDFDELRKQLEHELLTALESYYNK